MKVDYDVHQRNFRLIKAIFGPGEFDKNLV